MALDNLELSEFRLTTTAERMKIDI